MALSIVERRVPGFWFAATPTGEGRFPAILVLHSPPDAQAGWATRDAVMFAAHGFTALAVHEPDVAGAIEAMRHAPFCNGRVGVFTVGAGAERIAAALAQAAPDAIAMHAPSPVDPAPFAAFAGPLFLSHGCDDEVFPVATSRQLEAARAGRRSEVHYYVELDHGLNDEASANRNTERFMDFFRRHLLH